MSSDWIYYPCQLGENFASILFDFGIRESIEALPPYRLQVRLPFRESRPDGMPTSEEFDRLNPVEDALASMFEALGDAYLGRITVDGAREFFIYTSESDATTWGRRLHAFGQANGYELAFFVEHDPEHRGYWDRLFPTPDDWQVIKDIRVLENLQEHGDDGSAVRRVDHWAYFPTSESAEHFVDWLRANSYVVENSSPTDAGQICVQFGHDGPLGLNDITSHTISLRQKAEALGGEYDGWGAPVCKPEE